MVGVDGSTDGTGALLPRLLPAVVVVVVTDGFVVVVG